MPLQSNSKQAKLGSRPLGSKNVNLYLANISELYIKATTEGGATGKNTHFGVLEMKIRKKGVIHLCPVLNCFQDMF